VPGGRYPLPSSLLMTAVPARVAGVNEIIVMCPRPEAVVMAAAEIAGATRLFRLGGAHAIAALAFGTKSVPRVDRIVGPGNKYVALAKSYVSAEVGIDMQAGPSEILILSSHARPSWLAADLIAQAEHDPDARAVFITWDRTLARRVVHEVEAQMPAEGPAATSLAAHGAIIVAADRNEAIELANRMAPEHLVVDDEATAREVQHAGAIFIGEHSAQVAGDYAIGSNHVLPTGGAARVRGGLSAADFVRVVSIQRVTKSGLARLAPTVRALAMAEGLTAHAQSISVRHR
jgi:histidinol dehydrogenase